MKRDELVDRLLEKVQAAPAKVSLLWQGMEEQSPWAEFEADKIMVSASTIKTPILLSVLQKVLEGGIKLDQSIKVGREDILPDSRVFEQGPGEYTLEELLRWMILLSDNSCTNIIIRLLTMEALNRYFDSLGLRQSRVQRLMLDFDAIRQGRNNYTSARDQWTTFSAIYHHLILTPALCDTAMEMLKGNRDYELFYRYIPKQLTLAHKSGGLACLSHDSGIFFLPQVHYYLGIFVSDAPNDDICHRLIGTLSKMIWQYMREDEG